MDFKKEIEEMRENYRQAPPGNLILPRPSFVTEEDDLKYIFMEQNNLLQNGYICYGSIIQANQLLFKSFPRWDCPATVIYSTTGDSDFDPGYLSDFAHTIYQYKNKPADRIPPELRDMAAVITDELDRASFHGVVKSPDGSLKDYHFVSLIVFRKYIPKHKLCGRILPLIVHPNECRSIMILPKKYWTKNFTDAWVKGII